MKKSTVIVGNAVIPSSGGMPKTMRKFAAALNARIFSFTSPRTSLSELEAFPEIMHLRTSTRYPAEWYAYASKTFRLPLEEAAKSANLLSCHTMFRYHAVWVMRTARRLHIPYWFVPHGQLDPYVFTYRSGVKLPWLKVYGTRLLREASHVIFATEQERRKAARIYKGANTRVVHWPVDLIDTSGKQDARHWVCDRLGIDSTDRILLFLGRLQSMKRPLDTIEALRLSDRRSIHLIFAGPEEDVTIAQCKQAAEKGGVGKQVHLLGPVYGGEKQSLLKGVDAYISLSFRENFGHTAAESLSAATPVILSPGNDLIPELSSFNCGFFLRNNSLYEAAHAIIDFSEASEEVLLSMGQRGRSFIATKCSFDSFRENLSSLREEAVRLRESHQ